VIAAGDQDVVDERHVGETEVEQGTAVPGAQPAAARTASASGTASTARTAPAGAGARGAAVWADQLVPVGVGCIVFVLIANALAAVLEKVFPCGAVATPPAPAAAPTTPGRPLRR
jgi:hypothetical protein